jgi:hypothetical protein
MSAVWKVRGLALLLRVGTLWRRVDGLLFEVPPLASDELLTTLHPLIENVLQTVCRKLQGDSGTGGFDLVITWLLLEKPRNRMGRALDCMADVLMGFHRRLEGWRSRHYYVTPTTTSWDNSHRLPLYNSCALQSVHELIKRTSYIFHVLPSRLSTEN